ncbi:MAG: aminopeptidase [Armatimonadota bacterium]
MTDPRLHRLAQTLCRHSLALVAGEKVLIEAFDVAEPMVCALVDAVRAAGAWPFVELRSQSVLRALMRGADPGQMALLGEIETARMEKMDAYVGIRGGANSFELSDVPDDRMREVQGAWLKPVTDRRVNHTRWVVLRWPSPAFAQAAGMSTEAFEDFFFDVCTLDYARMARAQEPLVRLMERTDRVRIVGPGTDLSFSIKGIGARPCSGHRNIPDGECFSCPTIDSANGVISYNAPAVYRGKPFDQMRLVLRDGVIVEATSSDTAGMNAILDSDPGARRIGEFAIGFNPRILQPMRDTLFDEKIAGSLHFTPGEAYRSPGNGNRSQVHWDMVLIQRPEWGGGEIWFDDVCIRRDGIFLPEELHGLNPEHLV